VGWDGHVFLENSQIFSKPTDNSDQDHEGDIRWTEWERGLRVRAAASRFTMRVRLSCNPALPLVRRRIIVVGRDLKKSGSNSKALRVNTFPIISIVLKLTDLTRGSVIIRTDGHRPGHTIPARSRSHLRSRKLCPPQAAPQLVSAILIRTITRLALAHPGIVSIQQSSHVGAGLAVPAQHMSVRRTNLVHRAQRTSTSSPHSILPSYKFPNIGYCHDPSTPRMYDELFGRLFLLFVLYAHSR
jgi:hypothetical protein